MAKKKVLYEGETYSILAEGKLFTTIKRNFEKEFTVRNDYLTHLDKEGNPINGKDKR